MDIVAGDLLTVGGDKFITLTTLDYEGRKFAFVNKVIDNEKITEEYYIFEDLNGNIRRVIDEGLFNVLLPKFQELLRDEIAKFVEE